MNIPAADPNESSTGSATFKKSEGDVLYLVFLTDFSWLAPGQPQINENTVSVSALNISAGRHSGVVGLKILTLKKIK